MARNRQLRVLLAAGLGGLIALGAVAALPTRTVDSSAESAPGRLQAAGDCGAACLYLACRHAGKPRSLESLKKDLDSPWQAVSLCEVRRVAEKSGFQVTALCGSWASLRRRLEDDACAAGVLHVDDAHFVLALPLAMERSIRIADPARGVRDFDEAAFREVYTWAGTMLILTPTP